MLRGNKGEWSEVYTLFKILADKELSAGDSELNPIEDLIFPVIKILRDQTNGTFEFAYDYDLVVVTANNQETRIPIADFEKAASFLFQKLKGKTKTTFPVPEIEDFIRAYSGSSIKAKSSAKSDIRVVIHDHRTRSTPELGFSIKSQIGGASTLLNAGKTTNFIYAVDDVKLSDAQINTINHIETRNKIKDRIVEISKLKGKLTFSMTENEIFGNNLTLIDSSLSLILSELLLLFFSSGLSKMSDLVNNISILNPLHYSRDTEHPFYSYKIKRFLSDIALGMMPGKTWTGQLDATGGYLVVKEDGEILCYHIYNRNEFEDYLLKNTKLETASSKRHDFGKIYKVNDKQYFKLNLQIRFLK